MRYTYDAIAIIAILNKGYPWDVVVECDPQPGPSMPSTRSPPEIRSNPEALMDDGDAVVGDQAPFVICHPRTVSEFYASCVNNEWGRGKTHSNALRLLGPKSFAYFVV